MHGSRRFTGLRAVVVFALSAVCCAAAVPSPEEQARAAHALNRLGFGPRPGEIERVAAGGVEAWMRAQLDPNKIPDAAAEQEVEKLKSLGLDASTLVQAFQKEARLKREIRKIENAPDDKGEEAMMSKVDPEMRQEVNQARLVVAEALGELQYAKLQRAVLSERQLQEVLVDFWFNHFNVDARKNQVRALVLAYERDVIRPNVFGNFRDLLEATARSGAMLVYLDNWRSSREYTPGPMETAAAKRLRRENGDEAPAAPEKRGLNENYGRELLELHTLGVDAGYTQKDVQEVARAFTGWTITPGTGAFHFRKPWHDDGGKRILGVSLSPGGGEKDGERVLDIVANHPATSRRIALKLCQRFVCDEPPADYVERVAAAFRNNHGDLKATYRALFFDSAFFAESFRRAKIKSPFEYVVSSMRATGATFHEVDAVRVRDSVRAVEAAVLNGRGEERIAKLPRKTVTMHLVEMGQTPYTYGPPTGYSEQSSHWVSAGALVARMNFALALANGQVANAKPSRAALKPAGDPADTEAAVAAVATGLLGPDADKATKAVLEQNAGGMQSTSGGGAADVPRLVALVLGSPEFQRR